MRRKTTPLEKSWILYDIGNSAFVLIVVTTIMPIFFKDVAAKGMASSISTANLALAISLSSIILAISAPILGAAADLKKNKKGFWHLFLSGGVLFTLMLTLVGEGAWLWCLAIFVLAKIGWTGANLFYDSMLVDITTKDRLDRISSAGFAWGYLGSLIPFAITIGIILVVRNGSQVAAIPVTAARAAFVVVALWWVGFSWPLHKKYRQIEKQNSVATSISAVFKQLRKTLSEIRKQRDIYLFLLAYFFYIDGIDTVIVIATAYGREIGLSVTLLIMAVFMIQLVAYPFTLLYGRLAHRFSAKIMIGVGIGVYGIIAAIGFFLPAIKNHSHKVGLFWLLAFLVATSQGGIQALSRSFFAKLIPGHRSAEYFGFFNIFGKFATILGPMLMGIIGRLSGHSRYGILSLLILFLFGIIFLYRVKSEEQGERNAQGDDPLDDCRGESQSAGSE